MAYPLPRSRREGNSDDVGDVCTNLGEKAMDVFFLISFGGRNYTDLCS